MSRRLGGGTCSLAAFAKHAGVWELTAPSNNERNTTCQGLSRGWARLFWVPTETGASFAAHGGMRKV